MSKILLRFLVAAFVLAAVPAFARQLEDSVVQTEANCKSLAQDVFCSAEYLPTTCIALSARRGTQPLSEGLKVEGVNPCQAATQLRVLACEYGLKPDEISQDDLMCTENPPQWVSNPEN
jgi:hypothetical protein